MTAQIVQHAFNQAAQTYDQHCEVQTIACQTLIKHLVAIQSKFDHLADFGCGTGYNSHLLFNALQFKTITLVDHAKNLLSLCRQKLSTDDKGRLKGDRYKAVQINYEQRNFDQLIFDRPTLDLVFSNMALQWSVDLNCTLQLTHHQLHTDGVLAFSLPIHGTFKELPFHSRNDFYSSETIESLLQRQGYQCLKTLQEPIVQTFKTPIDALRSIKKVGAHTVLKKHPLERVLKGSGSIPQMKRRDDLKDEGHRVKNTIKQLRHLHQTHISYCIGYFIARKTS